MPQRKKLSPEKVALAREEIRRGVSGRSLAKELGVDPRTLRTALAKTPGRVRKAEEFSGAPVVVKAPVRQQPIGSWTLETIRDARDEQMRGNFKRPVRLAEAMRTDDALFVASLNRLAPIQAIGTVLDSAGGARGEVIARAAARSVFCSRMTLEGIEQTMVDHGIAIAHITQIANEEGTRVDFHVAEWPLEHVRYNHSTELLETQTKWGPRVAIVHGNGEWVVFKKTDILPWTHEACLLPAAMLWAGHAYGLADWAAGAKSHGQAKMAAKLPEGISLQEKIADGTIALSPEARAVLQTLQDMVSGDAGAGIFPSGTEVDFLANGSNAWQVFSNFVENREKAAARIYNGTDATMGSIGGAPGVDISILFGVASTKVQGDFEALQQGMNTGVYQPWAAINYGDSRLAPSLRFLIPDPDAGRKSEQEAACLDRLFATLEKYKAQGMTITQDVVNRLAAILGVKEVPQLAAGDTKAVPIELAPADVAKIVRVGAALRSLGLDLFGDERDGMTITELDEANKAKAAAGLAAAEATVAPVPVDARPAALMKLCRDLSAFSEAA